MPRRRGRHNNQNHHHHQQQHLSIPPPSKPQHSPPSIPPPPQSLPNQCQHPCTYKIDLHGMNEQTALASLARFLEECRDLHQKRLAKCNRDGGRRKEEEKWALVITGSGAHSPNGPVLRTAVQSSLTRRQMSYTLTKGRGSFLVDITTGIDFYAPSSTSIDSKVLVVSEDDACALPLRKQKLPSPPQYTSQNSNNSEEDPLPSEVMQSEEEFLKAKQLSSITYNTSRGLEQKDENNYHSALKKSEAMAKEDLDRSLKEEEEYRRILELSTLEEEERNRGEEEELKKVLEFSKRECCANVCTEEDEEMKRVLALSLQHEENGDKDDEDLMMKQAIEQSLMMQQEDVNIMKEVMEMSLASAAAADYPNDFGGGKC